MGDWSYLSSLLDKVQSHSTVVGKIWMSVLFLFRILIMGTAVDKVWGDEASEFFCDSKEPGCQYACYNWMFPISYVHYWVLQITFVSTPTLVYLGHAVHIIHKEKRMMKQLEDSCDGSSAWKPRYTDSRGKVKIKGILFGTYVTQLVIKIFLEVGFSVGQFYFFGSPFVLDNIHCKEFPCADLSGAQCFISRPTEKTIFIFFMLIVSGISVLLNIMEIIYLLCNKRRNTRKHILARENEISSQHFPSNPAWSGMESQYRGFPLSPLPCQGLTDFSKEDKHSDSICKEKNN